MKYNPFNLKTLKSLDIQTFAGEVTANPKQMLNRKEPTRDYEGKLRLMVIL